MDQEDKDNLRHFIKPEKAPDTSWVNEGEKKSNAPFEGPVWDRIGQVFMGTILFLILALMVLCFIKFGVWLWNL